MATWLDNPVVIPGVLNASGTHETADQTFRSVPVPGLPNPGSAHGDAHVSRTLRRQLDCLSGFAREDDHSCGSPTMLPTDVVAFNTTAFGGIYAKSTRGRRPWMRGGGSPLVL
jgi:hypothetical protein